MVVLLWVPHLQGQLFTKADRVVGVGEAFALQALAEDLLDFTSVGDLEQWLAV
jgi:hypothetical protein